jgi:hypothetical protein
MIQGCMRGIPEATVIILMAEERAELEGLARSTKTEHRLRQRARIVLLAADGVASRAIGRAVSCEACLKRRLSFLMAEERAELVPTPRRGPLIASRLDPELLSRGALSVPRQRRTQPQNRLRRRRQGLH